MLQCLPTRAVSSEYVIVQRSRFCGWENIEIYFVFEIKGFISQL